MEARRTSLIKDLEGMETRKNSNTKFRTAKQWEKIEDQIIDQVEKIKDNLSLINETENEIVKHEAQTGSYKSCITLQVLLVFTIKN